MKFISGDIVDTELTDIIHGCNAQGKMGSGVAKSIRAAFPGCYEYYVSVLSDFPTPKSALSYDIVYELTITQKLSTNVERIHNLITQEFYGYDGRKYATYRNVLTGIERICNLYRSVDNFAIPKIGCSLGGLQWNVMEELLKEVEDARGIEFWVYSV